MRECVDDRARGGRAAAGHHARAIGRRVAERRGHGTENACAFNRHNFGDERHPNVGLAIGDALGDLAAALLRRAFLLDYVAQPKLDE
jgi:hypothetical protein